MKKFFRKSLVALVGIIALLYVALLVKNMGNELQMETQDINTALHSTVAVFGATGTIGDGLLKAAMNDPDVDKIHVITRRPSPRIEEGVASGKVLMTIHMDYQDYSAIREILAEVDAVYWAIGLSAVGLDQDTYREIHATFPLTLVSEWKNASNRQDLSFHYISGSGAKADSRMMWAREKALAETELKRLAENSNIRVISYRPSFILPTEAEVHIGHQVLYAIFAPIKLAVAAETIGHAMLEISARGQELQNGTILENKDIVSFGKAYEKRQGVRDLASN